MNQEKEAKQVQIIIFSTIGCGQCRTAKSYLDSQKIPYIDIDIGREGAEKDQKFVLETNGQFMSVPLILFFDQLVDLKQRTGYKETLTEPSNKQLHEALLRTGILRDSNQKESK